MVSSGWVELGRLVKQERNFRGLTQTEFAHLMGFESRRIVSDLETARRDNYDDGTRVCIDVVMGWKLGSIDTVVAGGKPTPDPDPLMARFRVHWAQLSIETKQALLRLVESITR